MFILRNHNLQPKNYHEFFKNDNLYLADKGSGHFNIILRDNITTKEFFDCNKPFYLEWLVNLSKEQYRAKTNYNEHGLLIKNKTDNTADIEGDYNSKLKLSISRCNEGDRYNKLLQEVTLKRVVIDNSMFALVDQCTLAICNIPANQQRSDKYTLTWLSYYVTPVTISTKYFLAKELARAV
jgi:hypothetical protein